MWHATWPKPPRRGAPSTATTRDRKELDKRITEEANAILSARGPEADAAKSIVIYNKDWHRGIIGIVASRLTELYYKPAVVLTLTNGLATGSSRSVQGFDIYKAVEATRDLLENFGGHTYAVGLSLKEENIPEFTRRFEEYVAANILPPSSLPSSISTHHSPLPTSQGSLSTCSGASILSGRATRKPVFCTRDVKDFGTR